MPKWKKIICLANSRKISAYCIAGREIIGNRVGPWIRPVSERKDGELTLSDIRTEDRRVPQKMDIIEIPVKSVKPKHYQPENFLIDDRYYFKISGQLDAVRLDGLLDEADSLWMDIDDFGDKVSECKLETCNAPSLLLINPENFQIKRENYIHPAGYTKKKVRARFTYNGESYDLGVTDIQIESMYKRKPPGIYQAPYENSCLCISLGEPFNGYCYKLVASILPKPNQ